MTDLEKGKLFMKRELKGDINDLRTTVQSFRDLLIGRFGGNSENGRKEKNDDKVKVVNLSSDSSFSLATRSKHETKSTVSRRKGKAVRKSPIRLRSPIWTRKDPERTNAKIKDESEALVRSPWYHLTRGEFKVLVSKIPLSTQVITM
ncbi:unnamed protein product [Linum trigynum]|uniref:Uncharacterized protein n=1 Tax=Linum trigynum TaxID=586398 RepID=A0AAV2GBT5_9ROSI